MDAALDCLGLLITSVALFGAVSLIITLLRSGRRDAAEMFDDQDY